MESIDFDGRGNLVPYGIIELHYKAFKGAFVEPFDELSTRKGLIENYENYQKELLQLLRQDFFQWINGSFVTTKENPRDIDFVTILNWQDYEANMDVIESKFRPKNVRNVYGVDAYIMPNYPEGHSKHIITQSDLLYWRNLFSKTRVNRLRKRYDKGFIQLNYTKNERSGFDR